VRQPCLNDSASRIGQSGRDQVCNTCQTGEQDKESQTIKREDGMTATTGQSKLGMVLRVTSGNFLEMFDFFLSGVYASYIAKAFFPLENEYASLLLTFVAFGAGFLMRPLGAIILGAYVDRIGRRQGL